MIDAPRHELDEAIDRVAAKMVAIDEDAGALQAVMSRLPDRESRSWFLRMPVQAAAAVALVLMAFLWARPVERPVMPITVSPIEALAPPLAGARIVVPASRRPDVRIPDPVSLIPDPRSLLRQGFGGQAPIPASRPDHERSLAPVDPIEAIELGGIAMPSIDLESPAAIEPLVLTDLPLASDSSSPHER